MLRLSGALLGLLFAVALPGQTPTPRARVNVEGDVVNSTTGALLEGARVKLERFARLEEARYTKTDSKGHFQVSDLPAGPYTLSVEARGCTRSVTQVQVSSRSAAFQIALTPYGLISGRLTDPNGAPFPYTFVTILTSRPIAPGSSRWAYPLPDGKNELAMRYAAGPDDRGEFTTVVEPGTYYLLVGNNADRATWDGTYRNTFYPGVTELAAAKPVEVAPGQHVRADIRVVQSSGVRLTGSITHPPLPPLDPGLRYVTNVVMRPVPDVSNTGPTGSTTGDRYEFQNVPPGKYNFMAVLYEYHDGATDRPKPIFAMQQQIEVGAKDMERPIELAALPEITGTVTFDGGCEPLPLRLAIVNYPWGQAPDVFTRADGSFTIPAKYSGHVDLQVLPASEGDAPVRLLSARLEDRDVSRGGFEYPPTKAGPLSLTVGCPSTRRLP